MPDWSAINQCISEITGHAFNGCDPHAVSGGCINAAYVLSDDSHDGERHFFVKLNQPQQAAMFTAETAGLQAIRDSHSIRAPAPICQGANADEAWLVLEYLPLSTRGDDAQLGRELAQMHHSTAKTYGWHRNNTIGSSPQINDPTDDWVTFWQQHRLGYQLQLAARNGAHLGPPAEQLLARIGDFFRNYRPAPSLLHGDLWAGNAAFTEHGQPVIFDPAVYYGDRETDLAMSELFGGFSPAFYAAYQAAWPLDPGYARRKTLYNLYHILNHFNLFGGGYLAQAQRMIAQLLSEVR